MKPDPQGRGRKEAYCILRIWNESDEKRSRSMPGRLLSHRLFVKVPESFREEPRSCGIFGQCVQGRGGTALRRQTSEG